MKKSHYFNSCELFIDKTLPTNESVACLIVDSETFFENDTSYIVTVKYNNNNDLLWLYFEYGTPNPFSTKSLDTISKELVETKRNRTDVELNKQIFATLDLLTGRIYISNIKKKSLISSYIKSKVNKDVDIRNVYKSYEEFYNAIKAVGEIRLCASYNMMSLIEDRVFSNKVDLFGLGNPHQYEIKCDFGKVKKTEILRDWLKEMVGKKSKGEIENLVCVGFDDFGIEKTFNIDSFIEKFEVVVEETNGRAIPSEVEKAAALKLRSKYV